MNSTRATFKLRYLAAVTDFSIFSLPTVFGMYYVASQPTLPLAVSSLLLIFILVIFNPLFLYQSVVFTHYIQGTLGKLLTGLRFALSGATLVYPYLGEYAIISLTVKLPSI